jgi:hypothetical protein
MAPTPAQAFLTRNHPELSPLRSPLHAWHPEFKIEQVPDIECAVLPGPPKQSMATASEVLKSATDLPPAVCHHHDVILTLGTRKPDDVPLFEFTSQPVQAVMVCGASSIWAGCKSWLR